MEVGHPPPKVVEEAFDRLVYVVGGDSGEELRSVGVERARSAVDRDGVPSTLAFGSSSLPSPIASEDGGRVAKPSTDGGGSTTKDGGRVAKPSDRAYNLRETLILLVEVREVGGERFHRSQSSALGMTNTNRSVTSKAAPRDLRPLRLQEICASNDLQLPSPYVKALQLPSPVTSNLADNFQTSIC
nr:hypothetical protein Iba_chr04fCG10330 [Ipomoea batatas]